MLTDLVRALSHTKDMGWTFISPLVDVHLHGANGVNGEPLVGVDGNTEEARVGVDQLIFVAHHRVPQDAGIIQVGQASHVITTIKLGRVNLANLVLFEDFFLKFIIL